jgi:hypothetical protein
MRCLKCCVAPVQVATAAVCLVAAALVGGCASSRTAEVTQRQWVGAPPAPIPGQNSRVAEAYKAEPGDPIKEAPVEPATRRAEPDDPSEPFSPNYGRGNAVPTGNSGSNARVRVAGAGG